MASSATPVAATHSGPGVWTRFRRDQPWWLLPLTVVVVLGAFIVYGFWTLFAAPGPYSFDHTRLVEAGPYLSPFYSPPLWVGGPVSPALWVLPFPLAFRATCYYYRKAYYRSFFWDPPACAIGEMRHREYHGESRFPLILNNLHRFAMYAATIVLIILWIDAFEALHYQPVPGGQGVWYLGIGTLIMFANVILLSGYTFGCHSIRHLIGGGLNCYSTSASRKTRFRIWQWVTGLNERHAMWAWLSLFSVVITDVYIRLMTVGMPDPHITF